MKLSTKLFISFAIMVLLVMSVGVVSWYLIRDVPNKVVELENAHQYTVDMLQGRRNEKDYINRGGSKYIDRMKKLESKVSASLEEVKTHFLNPSALENIENIKKSFGSYFSKFYGVTKLTDHEIDERSKMVSAAHDAADKIDELEKSIYTKMQELSSGENGITNELIATYRAVISLKYKMYEVRRREKDFLIRGHDKYIDLVRNHVKDISERSKTLAAKLESPADKKRARVVASDIIIYQKHFDEAISTRKGKQAEIKVMVSKAHTVESHVGQFKKHVKDLIVSSIDKIIFAVEFAVFISLIVGIMLAVIVTRMISRPVLSIAERINFASENVNEASSSLSESSASLAEATNIQASSLEETSASIEELHGMVENNVSSAEKTNTLVQEVEGIVNQGSDAAQQLKVATNELLQSNDQVQELVNIIGAIGEKTAIIDEIVFQTKLLSFNASVEAERAGEHGRGFAVVAQEVGNLAQMSGNAAMEISSIVRDSISKTQGITTSNKDRVENSARIVEELSKLLGTINSKTGDVASSAKSILTASKEQATGIGQINIAVADLDKAVQSISSTSADSADSSVELQGQSSSLAKLVHELVALVKGRDAVVPVAIQASEEPVSVENNIVAADFKEDKEESKSDWESI